MGPRVLSRGGSYRLSAPRWGVLRPRERATVERAQETSRGRCEGDEWHRGHRCGRCSGRSRVWRYPCRRLAAPAVHRAVGTVVEYLPGYLREKWSVLRDAQVRDPASLRSSRSGAWVRRPEGAGSSVRWGRGPCLLGQHWGVRVAGRVARLRGVALLRRMWLRCNVRIVFMLVLASPVGMPAVASTAAASMTSMAPVASWAEVHEQQSADQQDPEPVRAEVLQHHILPSLSRCSSTLAEIGGVPAHA